MNDYDDFDDDDLDYHWIGGEWVHYTDPRVEQAENRSRKRAEWDFYHPGEPCPEEELS